MQLRTLTVISKLALFVTAGLSNASIGRADVQTAPAEAGTEAADAACGWDGDAGTLASPGDKTTVQARLYAALHALALDGDRTYGEALKIRQLMCGGTQVIVNSEDQTITCTGSPKQHPTQFTCRFSLSSVTLPWTRRPISVQAILFEALIRSPDAGAGSRNLLTTAELAGPIDATRSGVIRCKELGGLAAAPMHRCLIRWDDGISVPEEAPFGADD